MAGHAQLKLVVTECSKTQNSLDGTHMKSLECGLFEKGRSKFKGFYTLDIQLCMQVVCVQTVADPEVVHSGVA